MIEIVKTISSTIRGQGGVVVILFWHVRRALAVGLWLAGRIPNVEAVGNVCYGDGKRAFLVAVGDCGPAADLDR